MRYFQMEWTDERGNIYPGSAWRPKHLEFDLEKLRGFISFHGFRDSTFSTKIGEHSYSLTPQNFANFITVTNLGPVMEAAPLFDYALSVRDHGDPPVEDDPDTRVSFFENATIITV